MFFYLKKYIYFLNILLLAWFIELKQGNIFIFIDFFTNKNDISKITSEKTFVIDTSTK